MATKTFKNPSVCNKCGTKIGWHQLKSGKWMPVTALQEVTGSDEYYFNYSYGNNHGYTPCHKCTCAICGWSHEAQNMRKYSEGKMICTPCKAKEMGVSLADFIKNENN